MMRLAGVTQVTLVICKWSTRQGMVWEVKKFGSDLGVGSGFAKGLELNRPEFLRARLSFRSSPAHVLGWHAMRCPVQWPSL